MEICCLKHNLYLVVLAIRNRSSGAISAVNHACVHWNAVALHHLLLQADLSQGDPSSSRKSQVDGSARHVLHFPNIYFGHIR